MKAYAYDYNGIFIESFNVDLCQVTELKKMEQAARGLKEGEEEIQSQPLLPAYSTLIAPPVVEEGFQAKFVGDGWEVELIPEPKKEEEQEEIELTYAQKRAAEYPSLFEYLDGVVKSHSEDQATHNQGVMQVEEYVQKCLAIKAKYPKPE